MERLIEKLFSECVKRELEDDDLKIMREQKVLLLAGENSSLDLNIPAHYIVKKVSEEFFSENAPGSTTCKTCGRSEDMPTSGGKEEKDVAAEPQSCSICVDLLVHGGERSITKLPCQHEFHFDCIAAIYMARGRMQCPICSHVEKSALDQLCRPRGQMLCYNWRHIENGYTTRLIAIRSGRVGDVVIDGGPYIDFEDLYQVSSEQNNASASLHCYSVRGQGTNAMPILQARREGSFVGFCQVVVGMGTCGRGCFYEQTSIGLVLVVILCTQR